MRLLIIVVCLFLFSVAGAFSQPTDKEINRHRKDVARSFKNKDAIISLDTLFYSGIPHAVILRKNKFEPSFQLVSMQGEPLFWVELQTNVPIMPGGPETQNWRVYTFMLNDEVETAALPLFLNVSEKDMAREIIRHGLIDEKGLVPAKVKVFIERYRKTLPAPIDPKTTYLQPIRDKRQPVMRKSKSAIVQDNTTIALFWEKRERKTNEMRAQIFNVDGSRYTGFVFMPGALNSIEFETFIDGKKHLINVAPEADPVLEVTAYLVAKGYL